jgi:uncharacterized repeat protein (TIGR01451 family)
MLRRARVPLLVVALIAIILIASPEGAIGQETGNYCVQDFRAGAGCTAQDVRLEELTAVTVIEECLAGVSGETEVIFQALVSAAGSPDRYDVGIFLALDGGSALTGDSCYHDYLQPPLTSAPTYGDANGDTVRDILNGPWWNGELVDPSDVCGDIETNSQVLKTLAPLRFACIDNNGDGSADVSVCSSWDNNRNTTCTGSLQAFPGTNPKCGCGVVELGILPEPAITVTKDPPIQTVISGGTATFTITAESRTFLSDVIVSDVPPCDTLTGPVGDDGDGVLQPTETWSWICTVDNVTADFTNTATVTGTSPFGDVSDSDTADVIVQAPSIAVTKDPPTQSVLIGGTATFTITADNTGNVDLSNVTVSDDPPCVTLTGPTGDTDSDNELDTTETWSWTCTVDNVTTGFINTATVTGTPPTGPDVSDSDTALVTIEGPSLTVTKAPPTQSVLSGGAVTFTITAQNTGNVDLSNVTLSDVPACDTLTGPTGDTDVDTELDTTETWSWTCTVDNVTADFTNTATVTGTPPTGPPVSDSDTAEVIVIVQAPSIAVTKDPPTQSVLSGGTAIFTIRAYNTGSVDLSNVTLSDVPACDTLTGPTGDTDGDNELDTTETWSWTCTVVNVTAGFTNTATVTGTPPTGPDVSDSDTAEVKIGRKPKREPDPSEPDPPTPIPPTPVPPTPTVEVLTVARLPETGGLPGWFTVVVGIPILIGAAGLLNLALLEVRGRRGDGKRG